MKLDGWFRQVLVIEATAGENVGGVSEIAERVRGTKVELEEVNSRLVGNRCVIKGGCSLFNFRLFADSRDDLAAPLRSQAAPLDDPAQTVAKQKGGAG